MRHSTQKDRLKIICLGGSYTGMYLASHFTEEGSVTFISRDPDQLRSNGFAAFDSPEQASKNHNRIDLIVDTVPAVKEAGQVELPYKSVIQSMMVGPVRPVYLHLSSTSVYPARFNAANEMALPTLNENSIPKPCSDRAKDRLMVERLVSSTYPESRILRCGGIYGPGRCVATRFREGDFSRARTGNRMVSRIHVHDLCRLILAFGKADVNLRVNIVNAVDERPSSNRETFAHIETLLGVNVPGNWSAEPLTGRRVASKYAAELLDGEYRFPSYKEGFIHCLTFS